MKIRKSIGLIGTGYHFFKNLLPAIEKNKKLENLYVHSRSNKNINSSKNVIFIDNITDFLKMHDFDTVILSTPTFLHYEQALKILEFNKNVLCEKPLIILEDEKFPNLIKHSKNNYLVEMFMYQSHSMFQYLKKIIESEEYGKLKSINCSFMIPELDKNNFRNKKELGGGALFDLGVYPISLIHKLFSADLEIQNAEIKNNSCIDNYGHCKIQHNDISIVLSWGIGFEYENKATFTFEKDVIIADRIFSKPPNLETNLQYSNGEIFVKFPKEDQFFKTLFQNDLTNNLDWIKKQNTLIKKVILLSNENKI